MLTILSLTYDPMTVLDEVLLVKTARPLSDPLREIGTSFQVTPSLVYRQFEIRLALGGVIPIEADVDRGVADGAHGEYGPLRADRC